MSAGGGRFTRPTYGSNEASVIPFFVIMSGVLGDGSSERAFSKEDQPAQTLLFDRSHAAFAVGIQVGRAVRKAHRIGSGILEQGSERVGVFGVTIHDQESLAAQGTVEGVRQVAPDLHHPRFVWTRRDPRKVDTPARQLHDYKDVERDKSSETPNLDGEEVSSGQRRPMSLQGG